MSLILHVFQMATNTGWSHLYKCNMSEIYCNTKSTDIEQVIANTECISNSMVVDYKFEDDELKGIVVTNSRADDVAIYTDVEISDDLVHFDGDSHIVDKPYEGWELDEYVKEFA